jgi:integrase
MSRKLAVRNDPLAVIDRANLAESTKLKYRRALERYLATGGHITDAEALARHAEDLPPSGRAFLKAAVRLLTEHLATDLKGQAAPENLAHVQAALYRIEALQEAVQTKTSKGVKAHTWLSQREVKQLLDTCSRGIVGQRDRLVLGLLVAAGLRREEAASLRFEHVQQQPVGDRIRTVLAVKGKGAKDRVVPISDSLAHAIEEWAAAVSGEGHITRSLGMNREPGQKISAQGIFGIVRRRGTMIGKAKLAPHDLRRTYAQLGYEAGVPITQISKLLGHASVETTQRYLNLDLDLLSTASDFVPFQIHGK